MLLGLQIDHGTDYTKYVIHKIDDLTIDDNNKDTILTTSHDAEKNYSSKKKNTWIYFKTYQIETH